MQLKGCQTLDMALSLKRKLTGGQYKKQIFLLVYCAVVLLSTTWCPLLWTPVTMPECHPRVASAVGVGQALVHECWTLPSCLPQCVETHLPGTIELKMFPKAISDQYFFLRFIHCFIYYLNICICCVILIIWK